MLSQLLALIAAVIIAVAVANLAGGWWAVLFVGLVIGAAAWQARPTDDQSVTEPSPKV